MRRGEIWLADMNPVRGSEQAGFRPVVIFQNDAVNRFTSTLVAIPITANPRRAGLPSCVKLQRGEGGLEKESVVLCHQLRALDKIRLNRKLGVLNPKTVLDIEACVLFTLGIVP